MLVELFYVETVDDLVGLLPLEFVGGLDLAVLLQEFVLLNDRSQVIVRGQVHEVFLLFRHFLILVIEPVPVINPTDAISELR